MKRIAHYSLRALYTVAIIFHIIKIVIGVAEWYVYCYLIGDALIVLCDYLSCRSKKKRNDQATEQETWPPRGDL